MKQPDLGKRIAELRKAKGLTQDELVQKCNLNVRTLQRIESGDVTPRSYTMRLIFAALEYDIHETSGTSTNLLLNAGHIILSGWHHAFRLLRNLFDFRTNAVTKALILAIAVLIIVVSLSFAYSAGVRSHERMIIREKLLQTCSNSKFTKWFNSGQIDSISIRYKENACMMADNSQTTFNRKGIHDHFLNLYNRGLRFSKLKSTFLTISDSIAVDRGEWSVSLDSIVVATGTYMTQWRYMKGKWLDENEMSKSDVLPPSK